MNQLPTIFKRPIALKVFPGESKLIIMTARVTIGCSSRLLNTHSPAHTHTLTHTHTHTHTQTQEFLVTGGLFWSPLACSLLFILLSPSSEWMAKSKEDAIREAVDEAKREAAGRVPVSVYSRYFKVCGYPSNH